MDLVRVGDKLISRHRIARRIERILELRVQGRSQQDVADEMKVDRTFISRLETLGEVRKGGRVALIGFPVANRAELEQVAEEEGVEFCLLLTETERWEWLSDLSGADMFNRLMQMISQIKEFDAVVFIGSDMRIRLLEAILGRDIVVGVEIGASPIKEDKHVPVDTVREILRNLPI